jgi:arylsulfatase A-like enzyme
MATPPPASSAAAFIARWPARIKPGTSDALIAFVDLPATAAALLNRPLAKDDAPDSFNVLPALRDGAPGRTELIVHAGALAIRRGNLKLIPAAPQNVQNPAGGKLRGVHQLYDVAADPGERVNLADAQPEKVKDLAAALANAQQTPRTRPD